MIGLADFWIDTAPTLVAIVLIILVLCTIAFGVMVAEELRATTSANRPPRGKTRRGLSSHNPVSAPLLAGRREDHVERIVRNQIRPRGDVLSIQPRDRA